MSSRGWMTVSVISGLIAVVMLVAVIAAYRSGGYTTAATPVLRSTPGQGVDPDIMYMPANAPPVAPPARTPVTPAQASAAPSAAATAPTTEPNAPEPTGGQNPFTQGIAR